jgi:hypothetical protein
MFDQILKEGVPLKHEVTFATNGDIFKLALAVALLAFLAAFIAKVVRG